MTAHGKASKNERGPLHKKKWKIVKPALLLLLLGSLLISNQSKAQKVTISGKNISLEAVFKSIRTQTGFDFFYKDEWLKQANKVTIDVKNAPLKEVLDECFKNQPVFYSIVGKTITIKQKEIIIQKAGTPASFTPVHGKITNTANEPIPGATVTIKGSKYATSANYNGEFMILVRSVNDVLVVTSTNIDPLEITIGNRTMLTIIVNPKISTLDQVQVTAYGTVSKRLNTGSVYTVTSEEIEKNPVQNVLQAVQGHVPGLFITQTTGLPGGAFDVLIRSRTTFSPQQPLYIVDGVAYPADGTLPLTSSYSSSIGTGQSDNPLHGGNALNYLDPSMIESMNVLEGPDATAIYGSRGAYGVILITTKKGKAGKPKFILNTFSGISVRGTAPKMMNTQQYLMLRREAFKNDGTSPSASDYDINGTWDTTKYTDWQKFFTGDNAWTNKINANFSGGTQNTTFLVGANYSNQQNVQKGKGTDKSGGLHFNLTTLTNDRKFTLSLSGSFSSDVNDMVPYDFSTSASTTQAPDAPSLFLPDGSLNWSSGSNAASSLNILYKNVTNNLTANTVLKYTPVKGLTINATIGYNLLSAKEFKGYPSTYFNPASAPSSKAYSILNYYSLRTLTADPYVNYLMNAGRRGKLSITAGGTLQDKLDDNHYITGTNFFSDALLYDPASAAQANVTTYYNSTPNRYGGYFAIVNYNWDNKYILDLNGRRDGSTKFGANKQFGNFGSIGAAWLFGDEKGVKQALPFLSFGKIKGSYGIVGGDHIPNYQFLSTYSLAANSYQGTTGLVPTAIRNPNLQWETNKDAEVTVSLGFLKDRITVDGTYYSGRTSNQLITQPLSTVTGFGFYVVNSPALISTNGYEFLLNTQNIKSKKLTWNTTINLTIPHSKLVAYPGIASLSNANYVIGQPVTGILLYKYNGVDPETGFYNFTNKAGVSGPFQVIGGPSLSTSTDKTEFVDLSPKYYGGITNTVSYKGLSLSFSFSVTNRMGKNFLGQQSFGPGFSNTNTSTASLQRWQNPGDIATVQKASAGLTALFTQSNFTNSTGAYSNATYARLNNVNINYAIPLKLLSKAHISAMNIYLAGQNLLTISKYGDLDPENLGAGRMPPLRIFTGGLNFTF